MDIKKLRYFAAIAREGQITKAAKKLHMAQPPLSYQLKSLEEELGQQLFDRNGKAMELTVAGKVLYERTNILLRSLDELKQEVREVGEGLQGTLAIGSVKSCFSYLPERMRKFRELYPGIVFRLNEGDSFRVAEHLRNREIELGIVRLPLSLDDFHVKPLLADSFVCVMKSKDARRHTISSAELASIPIMLLHRVSGAGLFELVTDRFKQKGYDLNVICHCPDTTMILELVKSGIGAALLPRSAVYSCYSRDLSVLELEDTFIASESAIIWLKERRLSKASQRFLETFD
ncbi:MAG: LysR family transcriptional regulator [Bacillus sp. (in: firmicutes)]